jgi:hypothetical protein
MDTKVIQTNQKSKSKQMLERISSSEAAIRNHQNLSYLIEFFDYNSLQPSIISSIMNTVMDIQKYLLAVHLESDHRGKGTNNFE